MPSVDDIDRVCIYRVHRLEKISDIGAKRFFDSVRQVYFDRGTEPREIHVGKCDHDTTLLTHQNTKRLCWISRRNIVGYSVTSV